MAASSPCTASPAASSVTAASEASPATGAYAPSVITVDATAPPVPSTIHSLPCQINYTGSARVASYFEVVEGKESLLASFRGRLLQGNKVDLPQGVTGAVFREEQAPASAGDVDRYWRTESVFNQVTYWNHDTPLTDADRIPKTVAFFAVADALHTPVTSEEVEKEMASSS